MINAARKLELEAIIARMQKVSDSFYRAAQWAGHHAFLEFTGLMNEYIQLCRQALATGTDFTATTIHGGGQTLPMGEHNQLYLHEKLQCIYGVSLDALMNPSMPLPRRAKPSPAERTSRRKEAPPKRRSTRKTMAESKTSAGKSPPKRKVSPVLTASRKASRGSLKSRRASTAA